MPELLPLFPLGMVLFPGMVQPLHVFEPRYRTLIRRLTTQPADTARELGIVAIRQGWEVGSQGARALYDHGCVAALRKVEAHDDGAFDLVLVGTDRFRLARVDSASEPYLVGRVDRLADDAGDPAYAEILAGSVRRLYADYLAALAHVQELRLTVPELPADPRALSHLVAATAPLDLGDRHGLLAAPDAVARLRGELRLIKRELTMLRRVGVVPIPLADLTVPRSRN